uniref:Uncharacterized protein n=1 Tax=Arundo donax TaxID=35708 RepID=A0A0A9B6P8_ARUDO
MSVELNIFIRVFRYYK